MTLLAPGHRVGLLPADTKTCRHERALLEVDSVARTYPRRPVRASPDRRASTA
jgi:hypothetical protein